MNINRFNVRVYGLILNDEGQLLLSHEQMGAHRFVKFPGGGLEFGEGTIACLRREVYEECSQEIGNVEHFYTTDFLQVSAFRKTDQLLSIYYKTRFVNEGLRAEALTPSIIEKGKLQRFQWHRITDLHDANLTFPVDKVVLELLKKEWL